AGIAAAHRLPARAARHARRAARRLASLGAQRDSLLFTDLAWLLQAYAQAASAGGAPCEGETP
ncbi:hypothetical protein, partial [Pseudomonas aeruginosa]